MFNYIQCYIRCKQSNFFLEAFKSTISKIKIKIKIKDILPKSSLKVNVNNNN